MTTTTAPPQTTTDSGTGGGGGGSSNAGAIAGGVVGGVAVIGLIALGVLFLLRHDKKKKDLSVPASSMQQPPPGPPTQPQPGYQPPAGHVSYYGAPGPNKPPQGYQQQQHASYSHSPPMSQPSPPQRYGQAYAVPPNQQAHPSTLVPGQHTREDPSSPMSQATSYNNNRVSNMDGSVDQSAAYRHFSQQSFPGQPFQQGYPSMQQPPQQPLPMHTYEAGGNAVGASDYNANHHGQLHELS